MISICLEEISVSDTGPGLSEEVAQRLFTPFVTTKPQGLGLGLSISSGIIEAHGSTLEVASSMTTPAPQRDPKASASSHPM